MTKLSGFWIGRYAYGISWEGTVRFDAECTHEGAALSGIITEPNTFDSSAGELLSASISGTVNGKSVSFLKTYAGDGSANHTVAYSGELDETEDKITGKWTLGLYAGQFEMRRDGPAIGVKAQTETASLDRVLEKLITK